MATRPSILEALADPRLFGAMGAFADLSSWQNWMTVLAGFYGLPMTGEQTEWLLRHCGRTTLTPPAGGFKELLVLTGRQSGKTRIASLIVAYEAALGGDADPGDGQVYATLVAQDHRASMRNIFGYAKAPFGVGALMSLVAKDPTADTLELSTGVTLTAMPCRPEAMRGSRSRVVVGDEPAWWRTSDGTTKDREMMRALRPTTAMGGPRVNGLPTRGRLVLLTSPGGEAGVVWDLFEHEFGRDDSDVLIVQATAPEMNPLLPADYLEAMRRDDPEGYRSEVLGEFRAGLAALLDPAVVRAAVDVGRTETPWRQGIRYIAWIDVSGGRSDAYACGIGHREGDRIVVDAVRLWRVASSSTRGFVSECSAFLKGYGLASAVADRYGADWPVERFLEDGIKIEEPPVTKNELFLDIVGPLNSGVVRLPDIPDLKTELIGLERRKGTGAAHDRVVHPPGRHDDAANVAAGVCYLLRGRVRRGMLAEFAEAEQRQAQQAPSPRGPVREEIRTINGVRVVVRVHPNGRIVVDRIAEPEPQTLKSYTETWACPRHGTEQNLNPEGTAPDQMQCLQDLGPWEWTGGYGPGYGHRGQNDSRMQLTPEAASQRANNLDHLAKLIGYTGA